MRRWIPLTALLLAGALFAQEEPDTSESAASRRVAPEPPDFTPAQIVDGDTPQPRVTIRQTEDETIVEESRLNGRLYQITITPKDGEPYTLVDPTGEGKFVPLDTPGSPRLAVPMWLLGTF